MTDRVSYEASDHALFLGTQHLFFIALFLVACLLFHAVEFDHQHPVSFGHGLQAMLHGDDKKRFGLAALLSFAAFALVYTGLFRGLGREIMHVIAFVRQKNAAHYFIDPIRSALRKGIVHPKICA